MLIDGIHNNLKLLAVKTSLEPLNFFRLVFVNADLNLQHKFLKTTVSCQTHLHNSLCHLIASLK